MAAYTPDLYEFVAPVSTASDDTVAIPRFARAIRIEGNGGVVSFAWAAGAIAAGNCGTVENGAVEYVPARNSSYGAMGASAADTLYVRVSAGAAAVCPVG